MSRHRVLITGGAGFIGSHLGDALVKLGHRVRALDAMLPQVHGDSQQRPEYLAPDIELQVGDVRDPDAVRRALDGVDVVVHFAARVGVGQSMYEIEDYVDTNNRGTAVLLDQLAKRPVKKLLVASSMSIYGEGLYRSRNGLASNVVRRAEDLKSGRWEALDAEGHALEPLPTPETKQPALASVYALSKYDQERMCLMVGAAYGIPTVALRFFNVYGTRQALSNPYTGVLAIFASRLLNEKSPLVFEDGLQRRDFVHVDDVVQACLRALEVDAAAGEVFNVGSGDSFTVRDIARALAELTGKAQIKPELTGNYRVGDIRHCFADITRAKERLGYEPRVSLDEGLGELARWLEDKVAIDRVEEARAQLSTRGLTL
ncbi:MAG: UDP-glucose 4-epimerase [Myxococcaceae bacterium]|nr:UDP-glucose 4-epimerase [Myxococcaceae bacterium]